jgi:DUF1680 family protein
MTAASPRWLMAFKGNGKVGNSDEVTILEETDYPFNGLIRFSFVSEKPVRFSLYLRIPAGQRMLQ